MTLSKLLFERELTFENENFKIFFSNLELPERDLVAESGAKSGKGSEGSNPLTTSYM